MTRPTRRVTRVVRIGDLAIGGDHPILIQSMTTTATLDTEHVVREIVELVEAGCPLVRVTVPNRRAAENIPAIRAGIAKLGFAVPLVADIHFTPAAALAAAEQCEKVRINPGNYVDRKRRAVCDYTDSEYADELKNVEERLTPLILRLREKGAALRIGTNHGSLSDRILNRYGDTPEGMVESALEFVRICESLDYREIVLSMKSSIPSVMVAANRLLVRRMVDLGMNYPVHLGVTEAGSGLDGRLKSAIGIGALLLDGIGETIRVSLTEDSVHEIEACRAILAAIERSRGPATVSSDWSPPAPTGDRPRRRRGIDFGGIEVGGDAPPRVEIGLTHAPWDEERADEAFEEARGRLTPPEPVAEILSLVVPPKVQPSRRIVALERFCTLIREAQLDPHLLVEHDLRSPGEIHALESLLPYMATIGVRVPIGEQLRSDRIGLIARLARRSAKAIRFRIEPDENDELLEGWPQTAAESARRLEAICHEHDYDRIAFLIAGRGIVPAAREIAGSVTSPLFLELSDKPFEAAIVSGALLIDRVGDGLRLVGGDQTIPGPGTGVRVDPVGLGYGILQACRLRLTQAEFIACPSCGRTQFDLKTTLERITKETAHLRGVKIAIMGCIVNGPGEMADADFGYVGSAPGKVDLYVGPTRVARGLPADEADRRLIDLIREKGRWTESVAD